MPKAGPVVLRVRFMGGTREQHGVVLGCAAHWSAHANVDFVRSTDYDAEIRVALDVAKGYWSYIGTDSVRHEVSFAEPSMNLRDVTPGKVLHELGHALGLDHEHQHPDAPIQWNEAAVIADMQNPPNSWEEAEIRQNILHRFARGDVEMSPFDESSIMAYSLPMHWMSKGRPMLEQSSLSAGDKALIARLYPGRS